MFFSDYHLHTYYSHDGKATLENMTERAIELGLKEICFTDHYDYSHPDPLFDNIIDYDSYIEHFERVRKRFGNKINLKLGVEIGLQPHIVNETKRFAAKYPFDFIIGSTHIVDKIDLGLNGAEFFEGVPQKNAYLRYFEDILNSINSFDDFDVYGHIDYIIRYGNYENKKLNFQEFKEILSEILKNLILKGKGIEVNSSGIRYGLKQTHPHKDILKLYKDLGGEIVTVGSDAHTTKDMCAYFDKVYEMLREVGFRYISVFEKRKPLFVKI